MAVAVAHKTYFSDSHMILTVISMIPWKSAKNALKCVLEAVPGERVFIICDDNRTPVGEAFSRGALNLGLWTRLDILETGEEPRKNLPRHVLEALTEKPDIFINLLRGIGAETAFRIKLIHLQTRGRRSRLGHCPGVNLEMLIEGAMAMTIEEHNKMQNFARRLIGWIDRTERVEVTTPSGTQLAFNTEQRPFFTDTLVDWKEMKWMNLPTGEVIVAPVEDSLEGTLVCDLAIGGVGPVNEPVRLVVKEGRVKEVTSRNKTILKPIKEALNSDEWAKVVGEFAFGINPNARTSSEFLEAEKVLGTVHFAFGNNMDIPAGRNPSSTHTDFLLSAPTVNMSREDGETTTILTDGKFRSIE